MNARDFGKVAVLLGGKSSEREISLMSGTAVLEALQSRAESAYPLVREHVQWALQQHLEKQEAAD